MDGDDSGRLAREQAYHDARYEDDRRPGAAYYAVDASRDVYLGHLQTVRPGEHVLEYGCGAGSSAFDLAAAGAEVTGIDISPVAIRMAEDEAARRGLTKARFTEMNAEDLQVDDGSIDVVCGTGIIHHLDIDRAMSEVRRVLRPGGWAVFSEPLGVNPLINLYRRLTPRMRTPDEHPLVTADLELMRERFASIDVQYFNLVALAAAPLRSLPGGPRVAAVLHRVDRWLFRHLPFTRRWAWIVVVRLQA